jgi:hypothetical protein
VPIPLKQIVPLGRTLREYELMFTLTSADQGLKILGCGDGPASFNAEWTARGGSVISIDPIYEFSGAEIKHRFEAVIDEIMANVDASSDRWVWGFHRNVKALRRNRVTAMERFLADYDAGKSAGRYQVGELPILSFPDRTFDLALCSHLLFLYSNLLSTEFHLASLRQLSRVAAEVRVFPLLDLTDNPSAHLDPVRLMLAREGIETFIEPVGYEFQRGGNQMLRVIKSSRKK